MSLGTPEFKMKIPEDQPGCVYSCGSNGFLSPRKLQGDANLEVIRAYNAPQWWEIGWSRNRRRANVFPRISLPRLLKTATNSLVRIARL